MRKKYNSFQEINDDLKILKLKKEIAIWTMKNNYARLQNDITPKNLAVHFLNGFINSSSTVGINWKKAVSSILIGYLIKRIIKR